MGRVQKRYRGNTALGGIEDAVDPIAHDADAHRAELPAVAEELAARLVAQPEQAAVDPVRRGRPADGIRVTQGDRQPPARVQRDVGVAADRLTRVDAELRPPLGDEAERRHVGARQERRLPQRDPEGVVERVDRPRAGERVAELL